MPHDHLRITDCSGCGKNTEAVEKKDCNCNDRSNRLVRLTRLSCDSCGGYGQQDATYPSSSGTGGETGPGLSAPRLDYRTGEHSGLRTRSRPAGAARTQEQELDEDYRHPVPPRCRGRRRRSPDFEQQEEDNVTSLLLSVSAEVDPMDVDDQDSTPGLRERGPPTNNGSSASQRPPVRAFSRTTPSFRTAQGLRAEDDQTFGASTRGTTSEQRRSGSPAERDPGGYRQRSRSRQPGSLQQPTASRASRNTQQYPSRSQSRDGELSLATAGSGPSQNDPYGNRPSGSQARLGPYAPAPFEASPQNPLTSAFPGAQFGPAPGGPLRQQRPLMPKTSLPGEQLTGGGSAFGSGPSATSNTTQTLGGQSYSAPHYGHQPYAPQPQVPQSQAPQSQNSHYVGPQLYGNLPWGPQPSGYFSDGTPMPARRPPRPPGRITQYERELKPTGVAKWSAEEKATLDQLY